MKLYDIPKDSRIKVQTNDVFGDKVGEYVIFKHLDGAYSYCTVEGTKEFVHISASQELKKVDDYYELV